MSVHGLTAGDGLPVAAGEMVREGSADAAGGKATQYLPRQQVGGGSIEPLSPPPMYRSNLAPLLKHHSERLDDVGGGMGKLAKVASRVARSETAPVLGTTADAAVRSPTDGALHQYERVRTGKSALGTRPAVPSGAHDIIVTGLTKNLTPQ